MSLAVQHVFVPQFSPSGLSCVFIDNPMTSIPCSFKSKAATELSTPPLMATATVFLQSVGMKFLQPAESTNNSGQFIKHVFHVVFGAPPSQGEADGPLGRALGNPHGE